MNKPKIKIELTVKQISYLSTAFFEFGDVFNAEKEYMFKTITKILRKAAQQADSEEKFYKEKAHYKAMKRLGATKDL